MKQTSEHIYLKELTLIKLTNVVVSMAHLAFTSISVSMSYSASSLRAKPEALLRSLDTNEGSACRASLLGEDHCSLKAWRDAR